MIKLRVLFIICVAYHISFIAQAQNTVIKGRVIDQETNQPIPFANVFFDGTSIGTTTDFDGYYTLETPTPEDSLTSSYVGYAAVAKAVKKGGSQTINFSLPAENSVLEAVEIVYKKWENPAWAIIRNVIANRDKNDPKRLEAYHYERYLRTEINLDNIDSTFKKRKAIAKALELVDSIGYSLGDDGKPMLPIFVSEELFDCYELSNPSRTKEDLKAKRITGVGVKQDGNGAFVKDLVGNSFLKCDFYNNWTRIMDRDFVSPVASGWKTFYLYDLENENEMIDGIKCYRISFLPKNDEDNAFRGTMWIADSSYAIKRMEVTTSNSANINYVDRIKIQQEYQYVESADVWLPEKTRALVHVGRGWEKWSSMLINFYASNEGYVVNEPKPASFYNEPNPYKPDEVDQPDNEYWNEARHDKLPDGNQNVFQLIDTIKQVPQVKNSLKLMEFFLDGYFKVGKIDVGSYVLFYTNNNVEDHRFQIDLKTNGDFSKKLNFSGFLGYGTGDEKAKYKIDGKYMLNKRRNTQIGLGHFYDIQQVGFVLDNINSSAISNAFVPSGVYNNNTLFAASTRFGKLKRPYLHTINSAYAQTNLGKNISQKVTFYHKQFDPLYDFAYYKQGSNQTEIGNRFNTAEVVLETRVAAGKTIEKTQGQGVSARDLDKPIVTFRYTRGISGIANSEFDYNKFALNIEQNVRMGTLGRTNYRLTGGATPTTLPYPLLESHLGNKGIFYNNNAFNMMRVFEFASDQYASLRVVHRFDGFLINRLPILKKTKWRSIFTTNVLYGSISQENIDASTGLESQNPIRPLGNTPYVESGLGIENIFNFIRVDFLYRLTYQDHMLEGSKPTNFGIRVGGSLTF